MDLRYRLMKEEEMVISGIKVYRIFYPYANLLGGFMCEDSIIDNCIVSEQSYLVNSKLIDSYVETSLLSNCIISDSNIIDSHLTYVHATECNIAVDLQLCTIYDEELIDESAIIQQ